MDDIAEQIDKLLPDAPMELWQRAIVQQIFERDENGKYVYQHAGVVGYRW